MQPAEQVSSRTSRFRNDSLCSLCDEAMQIFHAMPISGTLNGMSTRYGLFHTGNLGPAVFWALGAG